MIDPIRDVLSELARTVRIADLFDVALVAAFLFVIITWLQQITTRQTSRSLLSIAAVFAALYVLARFLEMYLMETFIEVLLAILLLTAIVAFPSDMRRLVNRIGTWRLFHPSASDSSMATVDQLTETVAQMADAKTGALIALRGREPWDHLIQGGIELDGVVSPPLLHSLFNPEAPGHDGAVLLEGDRILTFAAHLPLSSHLPEASRFGGTRHTAALGLAEQCDAFVIVVSEERGSLSVAHRGTLVRVSASELKERLAAFWQKHYDGQTDDRPAWWRRQMPRTAVLSVVLAAMLWLLFAYRPDTVYRTFTVPIELRNLDEARWRLLDPAPPSEARVTLTGSDLAFESLDASTLALALDVAGMREEGFHEVVLGEDNLPLPSDLRLYQVEPATVQLRLQRIRSVAVPVEVQTTGTVPASLELIELRPEPDTVEVLIPEDTATVPTAVSTQPIELGRMLQSTTVETALDLPDDVQLAPDAASTVSVEVQVEPVP